MHPSPGFTVSLFFDREMKANQNAVLEEVTVNLPCLVRGAESLGMRTTPV